MPGQIEGSGKLPGGADLQTLEVSTSALKATVCDY